MAKNPATKGWSRGGSFFTSVTLLASRNYRLFVLMIITMLIPMVNIVAAIIWFIIGGIFGKRWLWNDKKQTSNERKEGAIHALETAGFAMFIIALIGIAVGIIAVIIGGVGVLDIFMQNGYMLPGFDSQSINLNGSFDLSGAVEMMESMSGATQ